MEEWSRVRQQAVVSNCTRDSGLDDKAAPWHWAEPWAEPWAGEVADVVDGLRHWWGASWEIQITVAYCNASPTLSMNR